MESFTVIWIIIAVVLAALEMFTGTFFLLVLALGATVGAILSFLGVPPTGQVSSALVVALLGAFFVSRWHKKHGKNKDHPGEAFVNDLDLGQQVTFVAVKGPCGHDICPEGLWRVAYRGTEWQAEPEGPGVDPQKALFITSKKANILLLGNTKPLSGPLSDNNI